MLKHNVLTALATAGVLAAPPASAETCQRADFEAAVGNAAKALRQLNQTNKPTFQSKLRELKAKRGWTHDQFLVNATPIVQDATITGFDDRSAAFLARIERLGAEGASADTPDCSRLADVRESMAQLVEVQQEKWRYMFAKISTELAR